MRAATATLPEAFALSSNDRASILSFASWLLPARDREEPEVVTRVAGPLLKWAQEAASKDGQHARMAAMWRAHDNSSPKVTEPRDPQEFLAKARIYCEFITGMNS